MAIPLLLTFLSSCSSTDYLNVIPRDSQMVIAINASDKDGSGNDGGGAPEILRSLLQLQKPDDSGIDFASTVFFFEDAQGNLGVCARLDDAGKLEKTVSQANVKLQERRDCRFAPLASGWMIGFNDDAALIMGPFVPAQQPELVSRMANYLNSDEDDGIADTPLFDKLDSIDAPMAMVCEAKALPQQLVAPFTVGAPKDAEASDIIIAASLTTSNGRLLVNGETFSFKKRINDALAEAHKVYRPIKGTYVKSMSRTDVLGLFLNADGTQFHQLITQNRGIAAMLAGINAAIDIDNILKSVDGDMAIVSSSAGTDNFRLKMSAKLSGAPWLKDVGYWKQSVPQGGHIGDWGKDCYYYTDGAMSYYFGVTPDLQYMSGGNADEARQSILASPDPIPRDLQKMIIGQKLVMVINFAALKGGKADAMTALLKPMFGNIDMIVYTLK